MKLSLDGTMNIVTAEATYNFGTTPCVKGYKWWGLTGKENDIMCGTYRCRICQDHLFLPLAGKNVFGCLIKQNKRR